MEEEGEARMETSPEEAETMWVKEASQERGQDRVLDMFDSEEEEEIEEQQ